MSQPLLIFFFLLCSRDRLTEGKVLWLFCNARAIYWSCAEPHMLPFLYVVAPTTNYAYGESFNVSIGC